MFRGAVMGFKGRNGGGGWFLVEEILMVSFRVLFASLSLFTSVMEEAEESFEQASS